MKSVYLLIEYTKNIQKIYGAFECRESAEKYRKDNMILSGYSITAVPSH